MTAPAKSLGIGILSARFPPAHLGGAELQAAGLARRLATRHRVFVLTRDGGDPRVLKRYSAASLQFRQRSRRPFPVRPLIDIVSSLAEIRRLRSQLDVLIAYQVYIDGLIGVLARRWLGLPTVVWIRGEGEVLPESSLKSRLLSSRVLGSSDAILAQSPRLKELARVFLTRGGNEHRLPGLQVVPNGVERYGEPTARDRSGVLFVGRLVRRKGVDVLLRAMRDLPGEFLTVVGDGPDRARLEGLASGTSVRFVGERDSKDIRQRMCSTAALVLPALHGEGLPNVLLEAMAAGLPVVASDVGGIADVVRHEESGLLVPPGDSRVLARELTRLLNGAELRGRLVAGGWKVASHHDWERVVPAVEDVLEKVVSGAGRTP